MTRSQSEIGKGSIIKVLKQISNALERSIKIAGHIANPPATTTTTTTV